MDRDPLDDILARLAGVRCGGDGRCSARCPAHDDQHASLSISRGADGRVLLHCHAGCSTVSICQALGIRLGDLFPPRDRKQVKRIEATYDYRDGDGRLVYQVVRFKPKDFRQRRPDGQGGWSWKLNGIKRVLYRLPELVAAASDESVLVVEGERDVDNLLGAGLVATCNPGGAGKWNKLSDDSALHGRHVIVIPDKDDAGRKHAQDVAMRLRGRAASVRILELPGDGKDVSDFLAGGGTAGQLRTLIASAPPAQAPPTFPPSASLPMLNGEPPPGSIDPVTGRLVLSTERTLPTAESFLARFHAHPAGRAFHYYAGMLLVWRLNRYVEIEPQAMCRRLLSWLHEAVRMRYDVKSAQWRTEDFPANPHTVKAALDSIQAVAHLPTGIPLPCWLVQDDDHPPAAEIVPCRSSLLHLPTMRHLPPTPTFFTVNALDYDPAPHARAPRTWLAFLAQVFGEDHQAVELLQDWFGYCLTGDTSQQKMLLLIGPRRSGKGTIARVLRKLIGEGNVAGPTTGSLAGPFGLQPLIGKSVAIVSDARFTGENIQTVVERLLCISGEDTLTIDRKHTTSATLKLPTRFVFLTNELPRLADASGALAGRFMMLRLTESFYGREDTHLTGKLIEELPGILNWAIEGWKRLRRRGHFVQPTSVEDALRDMEDLASPVGAFVRECCVIKPGLRVWVDDLYKAWKAWCESDGRTSVTTKQTFGRDLLAVAPGIVCRRNQGYGRFYEGLGLLDGGLP